MEEIEKIIEDIKSIDDYISTLKSKIRELENTEDYNFSKIWTLEQDNEYLKSKNEYLQKEIEILNKK